MTLDQYEKELTQDETQPTANDLTWATAFELLEMLPDGQTLDGVETATAADNVAACYDPRTKGVTVIDRGSSDQEEDLLPRDRRRHRRRVDWPARGHRLRRLRRRHGATIPGRRPRDPCSGRLARDVALRARAPGRGRPRRSPAPTQQPDLAVLALSGHAVEPGHTIPDPGRQRRESWSGAGDGHTRTYGRGAPADHALTPVAPRGSRGSTASPRRPRGDRTAPCRRCGRSVSR